jgi:hypothetical protein
MLMVHVDESWCGLKMGCSSGLYRTTKFIKDSGSWHNQKKKWTNKGNNKITVLRTILQRTILLMTKAEQLFKMIYRSYYFSQRKPLKQSTVINLKKLHFKCWQYLRKKEITHHLFRNACTKSGSLQFSQFCSQRFVFHI